MRQQNGRRDALYWLLLPIIPGIIFVSSYVVGAIFSIIARIFMWIFCPSMSGGMKHHIAAQVYWYGGWAINTLTFATSNLAENIANWARPRLPQWLLLLLEARHAQASVPPLPLSPAPRDSPRRDSPRRDSPRHDSASPGTLSARSKPGTPHKKEPRQFTLELKDFSTKYASGEIVPPTPRTERSLSARTPRQHTHPSWMRPGDALPYYPSPPGIVSPRPRSGSSTSVPLGSSKSYQKSGGSEPELPSLSPQLTPRQSVSEPVAVSPRVRSPHSRAQSHDVDTDELRRRRVIPGLLGFKVSHPGGGNDSQS